MESSSIPTETEDHEDAEEHVISYKQHLKDVFLLTYPIILSEIFQNTLPVMDIAFVGQLSKQDLAATALATVWFNLWNSSMTGFMTAIDTLLSQSYGANQYKSFQIWTGSSLVIVFGTTILVSGLIALCGPAMHLFGQEPALADAAGEFSYRLIPGLFPYFLFKVFTKYLQTQNKLAPGVYIGILANGMNALFNWLLIFHLGWGISGAPWATTLTRAMELIMMCAYLLFSKESLQATWPKFSKQNFHFANLKPFWKLAVSGALSITAEAWSFEITTILAGLLGVIALDAHIITLTVATFIFLSFPFAIGIAASIRVGQLIGDQRAKDAQRSSHASFVLSGVVQFILCIVLVACKDIVGDLFSDDADVASLVTILVPISCIFMMGDAIQATIGGVLRGLGRQNLVLWLNILGFWVCAVPIGAVLTFVVDMGVNGLWWGFNIGIYTSAAVGIWFLKFRIDWEQETKKTVDRLSTLKKSDETKSGSTEPTEKRDELIDEPKEEAMLQEVQNC
ncbi:unnamed protein product [Cylindrotheca closterium]|uniref:Uncharacterized protein n=1 Tax=Cylindrotheca closterium TaxID=2856 RepID=A0AAD2CDW8_9STRA|nr:unnamed protein product [Cylindrotheca closterium]